MNMKYVRLYTDASGESHFQEIDVELRESNFAPPAPPLYVSSFLPATQVGFLAGPGGWFGDWHPTPRRQLIIYLAGKVEVRVSDGEVRTFEAGDVLLLEDTTGKGHASRAVSSVDVLHAVVRLPD
jgi:hypothetical protein